MQRAGLRICEARGFRLAALSMRSVRRRLLATLVLTIPSLLAIPGCGRPDRLHPEGAGLAGDADEPRQLYLRSCASCHGVDGRGDGPVAPALVVPPADLTRLAARYGGTFPRDVVIEVIAGERELAPHGTREMPVWSQRFGTGTAAAASIYARRRLELLADHVASLQRTP